MRLITLIILFFISTLSIGQKIGISYGNTAVTDFYNEISVPKNLIVHYFQPMSFDSNFTVNVSLGYGISNYYEKWDYDDQVDGENKILIKGFPIELEVIYSKSISSNNDLKLFLGLGFGYYNYDRNYKFYRDSEVRSEEESKIYGFGQYYTFGTSLDIIKGISTFLQIKKLGLSFIKGESDLLTNGESVGKLIRDINTSNSFKDFGISLGLSLKL